MRFNVAVSWFFSRINAQKNGGVAEYPPSPARLLEAALAGAYYVGNAGLIENIRTSVRFLELQKAPEIFAVDAITGTPFEHFVHNNVLKQYDSEEGNTRKLLNPTLLIGSQPQAVYVWNLPDDAPMEILNRSFDGLLALGHGDDMAFARMTEAIPALPRHYLPIKGGWDAVLNVPRPGFLGDLELAHRTQDRSDVTSVHSQAYALEEHVTYLNRFVMVELEEIDSNKMFAAEKTQVAVVAAWVRHAAIESLKRELSAHQLAIIAGHAKKTNGPRVSYLPLPTLGHHTDGKIRRVCIVGPPELSDAIQLMRNILPGRILTDNEGEEKCRLVAARSNSVFEHYTSAASEFETITPVIFPHHLTKNGRLNAGRMRQITRWFVEAGFPEPVGLWVAFPREKFFAPAYLQRLPQYWIRARFVSEIAGPVSVGLGRFSGLGIFANRAALKTDWQFATNDGQQGQGNAGKTRISEAVALAV